MNTARYIVYTRQGNRDTRDRSYRSLEVAGDRAYDLMALVPEGTGIVIKTERNEQVYYLPYADFDKIS